MANGTTAPVTIQNDGTNEFVFKAINAVAGPAPVRLNLLVEEPGATGNRVIAGSVKLTIRDTQDFWLFMSTRGSLSPGYIYPTEDGRTVTNSIYPVAAQVSGNRDAAKTNHLIMVHGYNDSQSVALDHFNELYRRLWWLGFRGNFVGMTWDSDEGLFPSVMFDTQVENGFQTSPRLEQFLSNIVINTWGATADHIDVMAHSLGNLVTFDAMRLQARQGGGQLARNLIGFESATWPEAYQPEGSVSYTSPSDAVTYTADQLKQHSWAFWFNQTNYPASASVAGNIYHSYLPGDPVLAGMQLNDYKWRGISIIPPLVRLWHYDRGSVPGLPTGYRSPVGHPSLHSDIPTLMLSSNRHNPYGPSDINLPVGTTANFMASANYLATNGGWKAESSSVDLPAHSRYIGQSLPSIYKWYRIFLAGQGNAAAGEAVFPPAIRIGEE
jgi:hypothetical protein